MDELRLLRKCRFLRNPEKASHSLLLKRLEAAVDARRTLMVDRSVRAARRSVNGRRYQCSLLVYSYEKDAAFLDDLVETRYGFALLVTRKDEVAVLAEGLNWRKGLLGEDVRELDYGELSAIAARNADAVARMNLKNLFPAPNAIESQTLEADHLESAFGHTSASRSMLRTMTATLQGGASRSVTLSTGNVSESGGRAALAAVLAWLDEVFEGVSRGGLLTGSEFFQRFAIPLLVADLPASVKPRALLLDLRRLRNAVGSGRVEVQVVSAEGERRSVTAQAGERALQMLARTMVVDGSTVRVGSTEAEVGRLTANKKSFSLNLPKLRAFRLVEGADERTPSQWLRTTGALHLVFSDPSYAYVHGTLFRDGAYRALAGRLARLVEEEPALDKCRSEKGARRLKKALTAFPKSSVFEVVESGVAARDDGLLLDDLGDEWADFIGVSSTDRALRFYVAKHGKKSGGASPFQECVGQALKNLGRMRASPEMWKVKKSRVASKAYSLNKVTTKIKYVRRRPPGKDLFDLFAEAAGSPSYTREMVLVVSFVSRAKMVAEFQKIEAGKEPGSHGAQLLWILGGFVTACADVGVVPRIVAGA